MDVRIDASWKQHLQTEFDKAYFANLVTFVKNAYATQTVYPPAKYICTYQTWKNPSRQSLPLRKAPQPCVLRLFRQ